MSYWDLKVWAADPWNWFELIATGFGFTAVMKDTTCECRHGSLRPAR